MASNGYLPAHAHFLLDQAAVVLGWAFDSTPYLVGSCLIQRDYRDVDVRIVLDDEAYDRLFPVPYTDRANPLWSVLCSAISLQLGHITGLPVDFQIQRRSDQDGKHEGKRCDPLGIFPKQGVL